MAERKNRWEKAKRALTGAGVVAIAAAAVLTARMYQEKKETMAQIAAKTDSAEKPTTNRWAADTVEFNGKKYRRNTYVKAILCIGVDRSGSMEETTTAGSGGQADGLFLIAQDTARNSVKLLLIPRDTMTDITLTDLSGNVLGTNVQHLTLAYSFGDGREKSCEYTKKAVSDLLGGLTIDRYMAIDMDAIRVLNDGVGGVTVTVEDEGLETRDPALYKGATVTLMGKQAEDFVRYRDVTQDNTAVYRMNRHKQYMEAFFSALKSQASANDGIVANLLDSVQNYMVTDMPKDEYLKSALDVLNTQDLGAGDFYTLPGSGKATDRFDEYYVDAAGAQAQVLELFYRQVQ